MRFLNVDVSEKCGALGNQTTGMYSSSKPQVDRWTQDNRVFLAPWGPIVPTANVLDPHERRGVHF